MIPVTDALGYVGRISVFPPTTRLSLATQRAVFAGWLALGDALALGAAFGLAYWIRFELQLTVAPEVVPEITVYRATTALFVVVWMLALSVVGLYRPQMRFRGTLETAKVFSACTTATMLVIVATFLLPQFVISRMWLVSSWSLSFLLVSAHRLLVRRLRIAVQRRGYLLAPAIIVGTNEEALSLAGFLSDWAASGVRLLGFVTSEASDGSSDTPLPVLGSSDEIGSILERLEVEDLIVAITALNREELLRLCERTEYSPIQLRLSSGLYELLTTRVIVQTLGTVPLISLQKQRLDPGEAALKSVVDRTVTLLALVLLWPLFIAIAVWIKLDSPGPVIHRRGVLGAGGRRFDALKFRTMHVNGHELLAGHPDAAAELRVHQKLKQDPRVTRAGRVLRKYSLDELPQLLNVLVGQMSLVGPRMIAPEEADKYGRHRMNLLTVKPGITGLWQVSGRSDLSYEERVRMDMYYIRAYSIWLDLQILFVQTLPAVIWGRGAY